MNQELYIHQGKAYTDSQFSQEAAKAGLRLAYGDECVVTLHFDLGALEEGDTVMAAFDADMLFGEKGTSPMGKAQAAVTVAEALAQEITLSLPTNTERFYDVVNGSRVAVPVYFGVYTFAAGSEEGYPQVSAALFPVQALPVVATLRDTVVPLKPQDLYYTKSEVDASFVANTEKGVASGVATLDSTGKVPREQIPEGGTIVIDNALSTTSQNPVQNRVIAGALQSKANLVNGKVPASELPTMNYVPTSEKGIANGVATLDSTGKVPASELPTMNYVPTSEKGVASGVATLDANSLVPRGQLPTANSTNHGVIRGYDLGGYSVTNGMLSFTNASDDQIASRSGGRIVKFNQLNAAVIAALTDASHITLTATQQATAQGVFFANGITQTINTIPAATASYTLADGVYQHTPDTAPTYTLPDVSNTSRTHTIVIAVNFANAGSIAFQTVQGATIAPLPSASQIEQGKTFAFLCTYQALLSKWVIMPVDLEAE